jgi:YD repeat-containing protein
MERKKVSSNSIRSVGYDERDRVLEVEFSDGRITQFSGVSAECIDAS